MLETLDLSHKLDKETWKKKKKLLRDQFFHLAHGCWMSRTAVLIIFEGWDLSGKGDCVKFITDRQDPRGIRAEYFTEPRTHEKQRHWLHRFWLKLPKRGRISIFDTSWYRRVLAERVNGEVRGQEVKDAIRDIVKTERMLTADGMVLVKFLLHISEEEQRRRLEKREKRPMPGFRITDLEWGMHRQYDELRIAAEEALERTDAACAPWILIPANDPRYCQVRVFESLIQRLAQALEERGCDLEPYQKLIDAQRREEE